MARDLRVRPLARSPLVEHGDPLCPRATGLGAERLVRDQPDRGRVEVGDRGLAGHVVRAAVYRSPVFSIRART